MPFDSAHGLLTVNGDFASPAQEHWSFGLRMHLPDLLPGGIDQAMVDSLAPATLTYFKAMCSAPSLLTYMKLAKIQADGHYPPGEPAYVHNFSPAQAPTSPTLGMPNQCALAITMTTRLARGVCSKGRFFIPLPNSGNMADGRLAAATALNYANLTKTWLNAIKGFGIVPAVYSKGTPTHPAPMHEDITGVSVGRVIDTIRSRRRSIPESPEHVQI